ncbi:MAG: T9SS type A sorting domain-containing protein, partial [Bacteroidetes bacterium]|nr:T9SS type A sorting domain-containing protein [Bacteroidota bacterium]
FPNQLPQNLARMLYVQRYWQISHVGTGWTANISFPYSDHEAGMVSDRYQLRGVRQAVPYGPWEDPIMGTTSVSDPMTNSVMVHDLNPSNVGGNIALAQPYILMQKEGASVPEAFGLGRNFPNPFNPSTTISFDVAEERHVRVAVYNNLGMEVAELVSDMLPAGRYDVRFDATDLPSGTYLYRMTAGDFVQTERMTLSK